jgi:4'-phosphopantetheinyl transferase EntD
VEELFEDPPVTLLPEEEAAMASAVETRRREFATVRLCARRALARLGMPAVPLVPTGAPPWARAAPVWPPGFVGSMTHCEGYRAAAVARATGAASLGVDAEPHAPLPGDVLAVIALPEERRALAALAGTHPVLAWDRVLFSAKESVFKAWFPLTGRWLDFRDCLVDIDAAGGTFTGVFRVPGPWVSGRRVERVMGRWTARGRHVATCVAIPVGGSTWPRTIPP